MTIYIYIYIYIYKGRSKSLKPSVAEYFLLVSTHVKLEKLRSFFNFTRSGIVLTQQNYSATYFLLNETKNFLNVPGTHTHTYTHARTQIYINIYIYSERDKEGERETFSIQDHKDISVFVFSLLNVALIQVHF